VLVFLLRAPAVPLTRHSSLGHHAANAAMRMIIFAMALASGSAFIPSPKARLAAPPTTAARAAVISQLPMPSTEPKFFLFDLDGSHRKEQMRLKVCPRPCAPLI
jgi:hypothetical protein